MQRLLRSLRSTSLAQCMLVLAQGLVRVLGALARLQVALPVNDDEERTIMNYEACKICGDKNRPRQYNPLGVSNRGFWHSLPKLIENRQLFRNAPVCTLRRSFG